MEIQWLWNLTSLLRPRVSGFNPWTSAVILIASLLAVSETAQSLARAGFHGDKLKLTFLFLITCLLRALPRISSMAEAWPWTVWSLLRRMPFILLLSSGALHTPVVTLKLLYQQRNNTSCCD